MVSGFTNSGQGDRNEPKSEGPVTSRMCFIWILEQKLFPYTALPDRFLKSKQSEFTVWYGLSF